MILWFYENTGVILLTTSVTQSVDSYSCLPVQSNTEPHKLPPVGKKQQKNLTGGSLSR